MAKLCPRGKAIEASMAKQDKGTPMKDEKSKFMGGGIAYAGGGRAMKKGSIPPQLKKFVMAKKKKAKMKKEK